MKLQRYFIAIGAPSALVFSLPLEAHDKPCTETDPQCRSWSKLFIYPADAVQRELEGSVTVVVTVDTDGHAKDCRIVRSSGHEILDRATCAQVEKNAHFFPALDEQGNPTLGTYSTKITWRMNDRAPILSAPD